MDTARNQQFSGPLNGAGAAAGCNAAALNLMSAWCGFVPTPIRENPDAYEPSMPARKGICKEERATTCGSYFIVC